MSEGLMTSMVGLTILGVVGFLFVWFNTDPPPKRPKSPKKDESQL